MSVVYYKFKSAKDYDICTFDGTGISVFDLKKEIIMAKKLGKGTDFDLAIYNAQTDEEYTDDAFIVPRATSVIVRRLPASKPGKGTAQHYVNGHGSNPQGIIMKPRPRGNVGGNNHIDNQPAPVINNPQPSVPIDEDSEEARIQAMFRQSSEQWEQQQERMADATPIMTSFKKRPPNTNSMPIRAPPPSYVCFRCGQKGHYINNCPTNGDKEFDKPRIKRTTGIPKSFLKAVDAPKNAQGGVMVTPDGGLVVAQPDSQAWEKIMATARSSITYDQIPVKPELSCFLCSGLLRDAMAIPCCGKIFCDECIRCELMENQFTCPSCYAANQTPDHLIPNNGLRAEVESYVRNYAASKATGLAPPNSVPTDTRTNPISTVGGSEASTKKINPQEGFQRSGAPSSDAVNLTNIPSSSAAPPHKSNPIRPHHPNYNRNFQNPIPYYPQMRPPPFWNGPPQPFMMNMNRPPPPPMDYYRHFGYRPPTYGNNFNKYRPEDPEQYQQPNRYAKNSKRPLDVVDVHAGAQQPRKNPRGDDDRSDR
ncbi:Protein mpe1 [Basidiobolus ranarum]|uniref:Protein mpe1 n=1 Tax=Basidiobolus ranarum TaxID=34480 RepID=A0ABR2VNU1_9FUNG